jgi:hypothetical protein
MEKVTPEALAAAPPSVQLHNQMQMVCAGHSVEDVLGASIMHLASIVAFVSDDQAAARCLIETVSKDISRDVANNWADSREQRANAGFVRGRT